MPDALAIVSGGMDSVTLLHYLVKRDRIEPSVLTFIYGQKHSKEVDYARYNAQRGLVLRYTRSWVKINLSLWARR